MGKNLFLQNEIADLRWRANYEDGTALWEIDPKTHKEARYSDIKLDKIVSLDFLWPIKQMEDVEISATDIRVGTLDDTPAIVTLKLYNKMSLPFYHLEIPKGAQLIMARRVQRVTGKKIAIFKTKGGDIKIPFPVPGGGKILISGWQMRIGSNNVQSLIFMFPNGQIHHDWTWRQDADHLEVQMPAVKDPPHAESTTLVDAELVKPRAGLPDDVTN